MNDITKGLLYVIIGVILIIFMFCYDNFNQNTKNNAQIKKPFHNRWWTWTICIMLILVGTSKLLNTKRNNNIIKNTQSVKITKKKKSERHTTSKKDIINPDGSKKDYSYSNKPTEAQALKFLKAKFKGTAKVWYEPNKKMFMFKLTSPKFEDGLAYVIKHNDTQYWKSLTDLVDDMSKSLYQDLGLEDYVSLVNPEDSNKILYSSLKGYSTYDFLKEKNYKENYN